MCSKLEKNFLKLVIILEIYSERDNIKIMDGKFIGIKKIIILNNYILYK